jgi:Ca2+/Na+ antiporter
VGIAVGSIVVVLCVVLLMVCCICHVRKRKDDASSESKDFVGPLTVNINNGMPILMLQCFCVEVLLVLMLDKHIMFS